MTFLNLTILLDLDENPDDEDDDDDEEASTEIPEEKRAELKEQREFEIEACKSIWDDDFQVESDSKIVIKLPLEKYFSPKCWISFLICKFIIGS